MTVNISLPRVPSHFLHAKECLDPACAPLVGCECAEKCVCVRACVRESLCLNPERVCVCASVPSE